MKDQEPYPSLWAVLCVAVVIITVIVAPLMFPPDHVVDTSNMITITMVDSCSLNKMLSADSTRFYSEPTVTLRSIDAKIDRIENRLISMQRQKDFELKLLQER